MQRMIAFLFSLSIAATLWSPDRAPAGQAAASGITAQTSSMTLPLGALVELSPTLQPPVIGSFFFQFSGQNSSVITPDGKYMYVLVATGTENQPTDGPNKILTYIVNADGTLTPITSPQAGQDTTGTALYLANQGTILLTLNFDGSSASANTAPFQVFKIEVDGSLSLVPNSISLPAPQTVLSPGAVGSEAPDGSGQYFFAALIDNDPSDSAYMTSSLVYEFKIGPDGAVSDATFFTFIFPPQQPDEILNIVANEKFLYIFGYSNVYVSAIGSDGILQPSAISIPYNNDPTFPLYASSWGMQFSPGGEDFYAVDSPDGTLWFCHYTTNGDGTINFPAKDCQNVLGNTPSGEAVGAYGLYIPPSGKFLYSLFEGDVGDTCSAAIYAYTIGDDGALSPLNFASPSPRNSLPLGNNFCSKAFIWATPDGEDVYAFGETGTFAKGFSNAIVPFRINTGLDAEITGCSAQGDNAYACALQVTLGEPLPVNTVFSVGIGGGGFANPSGGDSPQVTASQGCQVPPIPSPYLAAGNGSYTRYDVNIGPGGCTAGAVVTFGEAVTGVAGATITQQVAVPGLGASATKVVLLPQAATPPRAGRRSRSR